MVLKDSKQFFPPYQGAPLMTDQFAKTHPQVVRALSRLAGKITTRDMQEMNYQVTVKHRSAAAVAKQYLQQHHLLK